MRVLLQRDCLGGERIVDVELPRPVRQADLPLLDGIKVTVLDHLPRPLFRVEVPGRYLVSGVIGELRVRFTVRLAVRDRAEALALEGARSMVG